MTPAVQERARLLRARQDINNRERVLKERLMELDNDLTTVAELSDRIAQARGLMETPIVVVPASTHGARLFRFSFRDGLIYEGRGANMAEAFDSLGLSPGRARLLSDYQDVTPRRKRTPARIRQEEDRSQKSCVRAS